MPRTAQGALIPPPLSRAARVYRAALLLYPQPFRAEFGDEMLHDFTTESAEVYRGGIGNRLSLWCWTARDLVRSVMLQWVRTGAPALVFASIGAGMTTTVATVQMLPRGGFETPATAADRDALTLMLLAAVVILLIASTIVFTLWFTRPLLHRRPHRPRSR